MTFLHYNYRYLFLECILLVSFKRSHHFCKRLRANVNIVSTLFSVQNECNCCTSHSVHFHNVVRSLLICVCQLCRHFVSVNSRMLMSKCQLCTFAHLKMSSLLTIIWMRRGHHPRLCTAALAEFFGGEIKFRSSWALNISCGDKVDVLNNRSLWAVRAGFTRHCSIKFLTFEMYLNSISFRHAVTEPCSPREL